MLSLDIIEPVSMLRRKLRQVTPSGGAYAILSGQAGMKCHGDLERKEKIIM